jgi:hypothetical protein
VGVLYARREGKSREPSIFFKSRLGREKAERFSRSSEEFYPQAHKNTLIFGGHCFCFETSEGTRCQERKKYVVFFTVFTEVAQVTRIASYRVRGATRYKAW